MERKATRKGSTTPDFVMKRAQEHLLIVSVNFTSCCESFPIPNSIPAIASKQTSFKSIPSQHTKFSHRPPSPKRSNSIQKSPNSVLPAPLTCPPPPYSPSTSHQTPSPPISYGKPHPAHSPYHRVRRASLAPRTRCICAVGSGRVAFWMHLFSPRQLLVFPFFLLFRFGIRDGFWWKASV